MFKSFTWAKFLADVSFVGSLAGGAVGIIGAKTAAIVAAAVYAVRAIASLVTTVKSGTATVDSGPPVNSK